MASKHTVFVLLSSYIIAGRDAAKNGFSFILGRYCTSEHANRKDTKKFKYTEMSQENRPKF